MAAVTILVRTVIQHITGSITHAPGDQYERDAIDLGDLFASGVVEAVNGVTSDQIRAVYGIRVVDPAAAEVNPPWPPTTAALDEWLGPTT